MAGPFWITTWFTLLGGSNSWCKRPNPAVLSRGWSAVLLNQIEFFCDQGKLLRTVRWRKTEAKEIQFLLRNFLFWHCQLASFFATDSWDLCLVEQRLSIQDTGNWILCTQPQQSWKLENHRQKILEQGAEKKRGNMTRHECDTDGCVFKTDPQARTGGKDRLFFVVLQFWANLREAKQHILKATSCSLLTCLSDSHLEKRFSALEGTGACAFRVPFQQSYFLTFPQIYSKSSHEFWHTGESSVCLFLLRCYCTQYVKFQGDPFRVCCLPQACSLQFLKLTVRFRDKKSLFTLLSLQENLIFPVILWTSK